MQAITILENQPEVIKLKRRAIQKMCATPNLKTICDFLLLENVNKIFTMFDIADEENDAKSKFINDVKLIMPDYDMSKSFQNKIYKVFKLAQYITITSEYVYVVKIMQALLEEDNDNSKDFIYRPIYKTLMEGIVNRLLKIYDKTQTKQSRSFSLINIQRDFKLSLDTDEMRDNVRNSVMAHLSLDHNEADMSVFKDYDEMYTDVKKDFTNLLKNIAPFTAEYYETVCLLNDNQKPEMDKHLFSDSNYLNLVQKKDDRFSAFYLNNY